MGIRRICSGYSWGLYMLALLLLAGCALGKNHFSRNYDVAYDFEEGRVLEGYQYYHFGYPHSPDALVAIRKGYTLASPKWKPIVLDRRQLIDWVDRMLNNPGSECIISSNGADILNDQGEVIGAWYSVWRLPVLAFVDKTTFTISDPVAEFPGHRGCGDKDHDVMP